MKIAIVQISNLLKFIALLQFSDALWSLSPLTSPSDVIQARDLHCQSRSSGGVAVNAVNLKLT